VDGIKLGWMGVEGMQVGWVGVEGTGWKGVQDWFARI
jgi:hypothetical protein